MPSLAPRTRLTAPFGVLLVAASAGAAPRLPDDPRLDVVRSSLQATVDGAAREGLPSEMIVDRVREGLAKGVSATRIADAAAHLGDALVEARALALPRYHAAPPELLRAAAEARTGGAEGADLALVLDAARGDPRQATSAVAALSDLEARGFPPAAAARMVARVARRGEAAALERLGAEASRLWHVRGGSPDAALDALSSTGDPHGTGLQGGPRLDDPERGPNRETSGQRGRGRGKS